jgi:hypothetical protein
MRTSKGFILALALACGVPELVHAQTPSPDTRQNPPLAADRRDDRNWGWIGLLGLAGLAGLMRRDRADDRDRAMGTKR